MTAERKEIESAKIRQIYQVRGLFRTVFGTDEGAAVLSAIFGQAGYYSMNPETVKPELTALCNWILGQIGSIHPQNVFNFAEALIKINNDDDLVFNQAIIDQQEAE